MRTVPRGVRARIRSRWLSVADDHRSIAHGIVSVGAFALVAKFAGAAKEMAVAWRYGASAEVDAYLFVFNLVNWPVSVWFGVLTVILIPIEARIRAAAPEDLPRFRAELLGKTLLIGAVLVTVSLVTLPRLLASSSVGLPPRTANLALRLVPGLSWLTPLGLLVALYSTWIMSSGKHTNTLLEGIPAVGILVGVLQMGGLQPLIWGTLAGTTVQLGWLATTKSARGELSLPSFRLASPHWIPFWRAFGVMMMGQALMSVTSLVEQFFAARLEEGAISSLGYASRILALILGIVATAITRATLPVFSRAHALGPASVRKLALRWAGLSFFFGVAACGIGWVLAPWAVRILFERGTFTALDTEIVSHLLRFGLLQLPFYFSSLVLVSLHASNTRYSLLLASGVVGLLAKVVSCYLLLPAFQLSGLILSNAIVYGSNTLLLAVAKPKRI